MLGPLTEPVSNLDHHHLKTEVDELPQCCGLKAHRRWIKLKNNNVSPHREISGSHASKMCVFWHVAPCCLVETDRRFRGTYCIHDDDDDHVDGVRLHL
jgi:hypothetical protein